MIESASMTDSTLFTKWRPKVHLMPPHGWANDPCAPTYDPVRKQYHLAFQWNPNGFDWGDISWACAISKDLINWNVSPRPSIQPSIDKDPGGVFTGCMLPPNLAGADDGSLTCFYTSAQRLPIHYTLPYCHGSEQLHMANSNNGGLTWQRHPGNPFLAGPPEKFAVTGWRDPFVFSNKSLDKLLGQDADVGIYGIIAGGIRDQTPTIFLYSLNPNDLMQWIFKSTVINLGPNFSPHPRFGDFGLNWEVTNIMTLYDEKGQSYDIIVAGVEGCITASKDEIALGQPINRARRAGRGQKWLQGNFGSGTSSAMNMEYVSGGHLDYGAFYAANSFYDPVSKSQIVHGWILEEDLPDRLREQQGWSGLISLPRKLSMTTIDNVDRSCVELLKDIPGFMCKSDSHGTWTVTTLSIMPDPRTQLLRNLEMRSDSQPNAAKFAHKPSISFPKGLSQFELHASFSVESSTVEQGLHLFHSAGKLPSSSHSCTLANSSDRTQYTTIVYNALDNLIFVRRDHSSDPALNIKTETEVAPHILLSTKSKEGELRVETLDLRIFYDVSVLEVFVNNRVAITTRVYPDSGTCFGIEGFGNNLGGVKDFVVWPLKSNS